MQKYKIINGFIPPKDELDRELDDGIIFQTPNLKLQICCNGDV